MTPLEVGFPAHVKLWFVREKEQSWSGVRQTLGKASLVRMSVRV